MLEVKGLTLHKPIEIEKKKEMIYNEGTWMAKDN